MSLPEGKIREVAWTALRVVAGAMIAFHGAQKILGVLTTKPMPEAFTQMWFGGVIELGAGVFVALGLLTRLSAFLLAGTMAVAYIQFHWKLQLDEKFLPIANGGELAALYAFVFLAIAAFGPGRVAVDHLIASARARSRQTRGPSLAERR